MKLGQFALLGVAMAVAAITLREWPEIARYMKMRSM